MTNQATIPFPPETIALLRESIKNMRAEICLANAWLSDKTRGFGEYVVTVEADATFVMRRVELPQGIGYNFAGYAHKKDAVVTRLRDIETFRSGTGITDERAKHLRPRRQTVIDFRASVTRTVEELESKFADQL